MIDVCEIISITLPLSSTTGTLCNPWVRSSTTFKRLSPRRTGTNLLRLDRSVTGCVRSQHSKSYFHNLRTRHSNTVCSWCIEHVYAVANNIMQGIVVGNSLTIINVNDEGYKVTNINKACVSWFCFVVNWCWLDIIVDQCLTTWVVKRIGC